MPQEPILLAPVTIDPTPADPSEKPLLAAQRLALGKDNMYEQAANFASRYAARFELVTRWLIEHGFPGEFQIVTTIAPNLGNPDQSYAQQSLVFLSPKVTVDVGSVVLILRDPVVSLIECSDEFGFTVPDGLRFPEPVPPANAPKPCPFDPNQPDFRDPVCRMPDNDSVGYNPGDTWTDTDTGKVWKMERAYSQWCPYHRWRPV